MSGKFKLKGGISELSSDIPLNWRDMRSEFGYNLLGDMILNSSGGCDEFNSRIAE